MPCFGVRHFVPGFTARIQTRKPRWLGVLSVIGVEPLHQVEGRLRNGALLIDAAVYVHRNELVLCRVRFGAEGEADSVAALMGEFSGLVERHPRSNVGCVGCLPIERIDRGLCPFAIPPDLPIGNPSVDAAEFERNHLRRVIIDVRRRGLGWSSRHRRLTFPHGRRPPFRCHRSIDVKATGSVREASEPHEVR